MPALTPPVDSNWNKLSCVFDLAGCNSQENEREKEEAEKCSLVISLCVNK